LNNFPDTVLSQYNDSPVLCQLITNFNSVVDPQYLLDQFYTYVWDVRSAIGYGLDRIGRVVGITRVLTITVGEYLGLENQAGGVGDASGDAFNAAIFYTGQPTTSNFSLTDEAYRTLIYAKAASNITNGSIPAINYILMNILFPDRGNCYVQDNQNMTLTYVFEFPLHPYELSIVQTSNVLPTGCGVLANVTYPGLLAS
jgi:hypothetical protein